MIVDPVARTISWSAGIDFDPDVLPGDQPPASGTGPNVLASTTANRRADHRRSVGRGGTKPSHTRHTDRVERRLSWGSVSRVAQNRP